MNGHDDFILKITVPKVAEKVAVNEGKVAETVPHEQSS